MPYRIEHDESLADGLVRAAREQVDRALVEIEDGQLDEHRSVRQVVRRCQRVRSLYRLVGTAAPEVCEREDARYVGIVRPLAELRSADAHLDAFDVVHRHFRRPVDEDAMGVVRETLEERRDELADELGVDERLEVARDRLREAREHAGDLQLAGDGYEALAGGLARTYAEARDGFTDAYEQATTRAFHRWYRLVRAHRHHVSLLQDVWPAVLEARHDELQDLTDVTGDDRELAELRATLLTEPENFPNDRMVDAFVGLLDRQRARLQREAEPLGAKLFAEEPDAFVDRVRTAWETWRSEPATTGTATASVAGSGR